MSVLDYLTGAGTGAVSGAAAGSTFGPWGAGIGAGVGALTGAAGARKGSILQNPEVEKKFDIYTPDQQNFLDSLLDWLKGGQAPEGGLLGDLANSDASQNRAMRQFNEQTIPGLAERFSGTGAGAQSSSAFRQSLGTSAADLQERLAELDMNQKLAIFGPVLSAALAPRTEQYYEPSGPSGIQKGITAILGGLASGFGNKLASKDYSGFFENKSGVKRAPQGGNSGIKNRTA